MPTLENALNQAETGDLNKFSRLEASLVKAEVEQRPMSRQQNDVSRHAATTDLFVNELDFDFHLDSTHYPLGDLRSLHQVFDAVQSHHHLANEENFSLETQVECLEVGLHGGGVLLYHIIEPALCVHCV